ncbi:MAG: mobile element hypothetical protein [Bacteroidetes bacterium HLUCCA01]|nr:MAG: mobile element hypothetical protein [Bacteroidetes bacterium HLUCCA01]
MKPYKEALADFKKAKEAERNARLNITATQDEYKKATAAIPKVYEELTSIMADAEAGLATDRNVEDMRIRFKRVQDEANEAKMRLDVAEKLLPVRKAQLKDAQTALKLPAESYFRQKAEPILTALIETADKLQDYSKHIEAIRQEMDGSGIYSDNIVPYPFNLNFDLIGNVRKLTYPQFREQILTIKNSKA